MQTRLKTIFISAFCVIALACAFSQSSPNAMATSPQASSMPPAPPASIAKVEGPSLKNDKARDMPGLHNVVAFYDGFWSGSVPEGDAGFDTLAAMGVKTIISVDGAAPDVAMAKARGIRYIHLPIGYNGFDEKRRLELARATRDAMKDGTVYVHCHHGQHRSAGAAGAAVASLGWLTPEEATVRMKVSGTSPNYKGLYSCVAESSVLDPKAIDAVSADFPEISQPASYVKAMVEIDEINDRLKLIEKAGWTVPKDHPDLVPAAEAGRMADLFRLVAESEKSKAQPENFAASLKLDGERMTQIEAMIVAGEKDPKKMSNHFKLIQTSCKDCHTKYRD